MNIFVTKLSSETDEKSLRNLFEKFGQVSTSRIIVDRDTGRSKCYGFVEMNNDDEGYDAINELNETEFEGSTIIVKKAESRPQQRSFQGGRNSGGGGGYNRNNRRY